MCINSGRALEGDLIAELLARRKEPSKPFGFGGPFQTRMVASPAPEAALIAACCYVLVDRLL
jgi:hypothetical protein